MNADLHAIVKTAFEDSLTVRRVAPGKTLARRFDGLRLQAAMYCYS